MKSLLSTGQSTLHHQIYSAENCSLQEIGRGCFSRVYKTVNRIDGCFYAVKCSHRQLRQDSERLDLHLYYDMYRINAFNEEHPSPFFLDWHIMSLGVPLLRAVFVRTSVHIIDVRVDANLICNVQETSFDWGLGIGSHRWEVLSTLLNASMWSKTVSMISCCSSCASFQTCSIDIG